ncbi:nucleotidyltransferase [Halalkalibacter sp. APA_J-10(15)]|uniref:nucleotidyltransferase n=1 Tax=Halalkalibacter sp. APA_J-10(15) TaxID=2933805 RepID=UPI001FF2BCFE|nr:nucleotidyltransferase [Halalkalibacter sp. APA_J-10(15)]MCK0470646.1 nucleotidyltransferase [Halalkalibacter sp. APA_J-10(15)]
MQAVGIVVEYNPFHNGHLYQLTQAKKETEADIVIVVMSGTFLQRGEPALISKWSRTEMALANGADLVIELPYPFSAQKAEYFAHGAVQLLTELGVEFIHFGSEAGDILPFYELVDTIQKDFSTINSYVQEHMKLGLSYPRAFSNALTRLNRPTAISLTEPNNILGYHYVKAITDQGSPIKATTTKRIQAHFHEQSISSNHIASATSIRKAINEGTPLADIAHTMPASTVNLLTKYKKENKLLHTWDLYYPFVQYKILSSSCEQLRDLYECEEGLEYRLKETIKFAPTYTDWIELLKTKRYTRTRLQRLVTHVLTNTTKEEMQTAHSEGLRHIQLLGFTTKGQQFLKQTRKQRNLPILTKRAKATGGIAELEERAAVIYAQPLLTHARYRAIKAEFNPPIQLHSH